MDIKVNHKKVHLLKSASSREDYFPKQSIDLNLTNDKEGIYKWFEPSNNYPEYVIQSLRKSITLESILYEDLIYKTGSGFSTNDSAFNSYLNKDIVNINNELFQVVFKDANDHINKLGNVFLELIFDERFNLLSTSTIQPQKCRLIKDDKNIWLYPDWSKFDKEKAKKMPLYPRMKKFTSDGIVFYKSIYHIKNKVLGFDHYGINDKLIEALLLNEKEHRRNEWQNSQLKKGFKRDFFLVTEYPLSEKEKKKLDEAFADDSGSENAGGVYSIEGEGAKLVAADANYEFDFNKDDTTEKTFLKMGFPRSLIGIKSGAAFSVEQVESDYDQYLPKIEGQQRFLMSEFNKIFKEHTSFNTSDVSVTNTPPSVILQNYMPYMTDDQKNKVIEKVFKRYGID